MLRVMAQYGLKYADGMELYGKYVGNWGGTSTVWRFEGKIGGKTVITRSCCPGVSLHLEALPSQTELHEGDCYDMAAVRIRVADEFGHTAPYAQLAIQMKTHGPVKLAGPAVITAEGGFGGTYLRTTGRAGKASLTLSADGLEPLTLEFSVKKD